ncbi:MAG: adenine deaminase [Candidatus Anoxymicrobium japonicum]|uniref:Adenine deaminase n=1 Tax=Candidatus Anoxymicrobium japonicum TaxID=2013648 RepID=A0A2N3G427_9ACTN|nr:MAG: adenine deaminase [Candidatus Anoxymicrobium japonicum]
MKRDRMIKLARGEGKVDLLLTNCMLVNVLSGAVHPASVAVSGGVIAGIDRGYAARETIDLGGMYLAPGLMDAHIHLESSMLTVPEFARVVVPHGTTTVVTDCHEIANVMGAIGVRYMIESSRSVPLNVFVMLPSCVPATPLETSGAVLDARDLEALKGEPGVIGLGELMNFPGTIAGDPGVLAKLDLFEGMPIDGHAPGLSGMNLSAYIAASPDSDHECVTVAEAEEKLQKGMYVFLRQGTGAKNLLDLLPVANASNSRRCCLCVDDRHPAELLASGHIDSLLKLAVGAGVPAMTAIQMATLNTARRFRLPSLGALAPGYRADMVVFDDLKTLDVRMVFKDGKMVASAGALDVEIGKAPAPGSSFHVAEFGLDRLRLSGKGNARVIGIVPGQIVTESLVADVQFEGGVAVPDVARDILKIAVVERHKGTGNVGVAFVRGFGLKSGALASSVAHDSHNIVVVGCSDDDMAVAVEKVIEMGGGQVVVAGGDVKASLALPLAGLMSPLPAADVAAQVEGLNTQAADLGCGLQDPFMTMSFLALPVIPSLKLTDRGLVNVETFDFVSPFI